MKKVIDICGDCGTLVPTDVEYCVICTAHRKKDKEYFDKLKKEKDKG